MRTSRGKITALLAVLLAIVFPMYAQAASCQSKLFTVTIDSKLSIGDAIENLADTCDLTVTVKDEWARKRLEKKLYFVKLKNTTLKGFLDTVLTDNDLSYTLEGNRLLISYFITKTYRVHYVSGQRTGKSSANVTIANSNNSASNGGGGGGTEGSNGANSGIVIESNDEFKFWTTIQTEIQRILIGAGDGSTHYTRNGETWTGPDGQVWEYNPVAPIINADAGMLTVTGTQRQIDRVDRYIKTLESQISKQVLIDVKILTVTFDDSSTTGIDWSQLYKLQNVNINTLAMKQYNLSEWTSTAGEPITGAKYASGSEPKSANLIEVAGTTEISEVIKFLGTQGDVKSVSSPRVMTLNNQPALISVGKELFYKIKSSSTASSTGGAVAAEGETVDSVFAGVLLDITPEIGNNGEVTLKINPSITDTLDAVTADGTIRSIPPDLIKRQIASVIKVNDGNHAILGGLITTQTGKNISKVPLLGDIPLLEYAFKKEEKIENVVELVIIITPHIVKKESDVTLRDLGYRKINGK